MFYGTGQQKALRIPHDTLPNDEIRHLLSTANVLVSLQERKGEWWTITTCIAAGAVIRLFIVGYPLKDNSRLCFEYLQHRF